MKKGDLIVGYIILLMLILSGIFLSGLGIALIIDEKHQTSNYIEITGEYIDNKIYSQDEDGTTYSLIYSYVVDGKNYTVSTNYGTNVLPEKGSTKKIKYDPSNPSNAVVIGFNASYLLIISGICFIVGALVLKPSKKANTYSNNKLENNNYDIDDYEIEEDNDYSNISILEDSGVMNILKKTRGIYSIIFGLIFTSISILFLITLESYGKVFALPFVIFGMTIIIEGFVSMKGTSKINLLNNIRTISFGIYWYGILIFSDYICIKNGQWGMFLFTLIFWAAGILIFYKKK